MIKPGIPLLASVLAFCGFSGIAPGQNSARTDLAQHARATASSVLESRYAPENAVDGVVSDDSRWVSRRDDQNKWLELDLGQARNLRVAHVYSGWQEGDAMKNFALEAWNDGRWQAIPGGKSNGNTSVITTLRFEQSITAQRVRLLCSDNGPARLREIALYAETVPPGTGLTFSSTPTSPTFPTNRHLIAVNQVGYATAFPKRFTAPLSADGSRFEIRKMGADQALYRGIIRGHIGDFSTFHPDDGASEYEILVRGGALEPGRSDPFSIRRRLYEEAFWQGAVDFMSDSRSVVGTHPSAYGGCPWRDGTYYDFIVPSLVELYLANPDRVQAMPVQLNWKKDGARVLSPDFKFDARNPHPEGVLEAARRYYKELEPPGANTPDLVQLIHWGLGYYLMNPATRDPSADPLPKQIHSQTVEQFAFFLAAWPQFKQWLPGSFYERCRDFTFEHWEKSGLFEVDPLWSAKTYMSEQQIPGGDPSGGLLHPFKGRHAPGHSIQPNLLMYEVARREGRTDADRFLKAAQTQARWIIDQLDWNDPRTTKGQRMSEQKTITGLVWFLQNYPEQAPTGLRPKIVEWARVAIERSQNLWDFRRYDLNQNWSIPELNETGNLVGFTAAALAASWVVEDDAMKLRLQEIAIAQMDNVFGRNPKLAAATEHPEQGFPLVERGWPLKFPNNVCARLETTRGCLAASPGTEMYPFNPNGKYRHAEGWVNFNAAWNVALAYLRWAEAGHAP